MTKKFGFTLSEVLITLAVIGVVAAMTLPILIQKQQKMAWTSQLKKSYSTLEQGFKLMMADEGVDDLMNVSFFSVLEEEGECYMPDSDTNNTGTCKPLFDGLKKYFKGNYGTWDRQVCNLNDRVNCSDWSGDPLFTMPDGTQVEIDFILETIDIATCNTIKSLGGNMCSNLGNISIDVNGRKGPNTNGRDIFLFVLSNDGRLYPWHGKDHALYWNPTPLDNNGSYWRKNTNEACGTQGGKADESWGYGCAARIMEEGWKMDY